MALEPSVTPVEIVGSRLQSIPSRQQGGKKRGGPGFQLGTRNEEEEAVPAPVAGPELPLSKHADDEAGGLVDLIG